MEKNVDAVWKKASERFPTSTSAWLKSVAGGDLSEAKRAIQDVLTGGSSVKTVSNVGAMALLRQLAQQPQLISIISSLLTERQNMASSSHNREDHILHQAAKNGCIADLRQAMKKEHVDVLNSHGETPLHLAAEFDHPADVEILLQLGASLTADRHGCTALHSAAMSTSPNSTIARLLVNSAAERDDNFRLLNQRSNAIFGSNTALHMAAGNVNVTPEFIEELRDADPRLQNAELDTAFHVAAKSSKSNAIVYLLTTFRPTNAGWDIDSVDETRGEKAPTLVNMCAGNGNAEAVTLLIQHGADISQGVLHEIVTASVKKPDMLQKFLAVYQAVVDNVVTWKCLRERRKCPIRGSREYRKVLRETLIHLTTTPFTDDKNMIQRCIQVGASEMLLAVLNTEHVYRLDEFGVRRNDLLRVMCSYSRYDVTDFAILSSPLLKNETGDENPEDNSGSHDVDLNSRKGRRLKLTYLEELVLHQEEWKDKNILATQPLRKLTKPYFAFVQRYYLILGVIQLIFVICFSAYYLPDACSLARLFLTESARCNITFNAPTSGESNITTSDSLSGLQRQSPLWLWLVWPVIIFIGSTWEFFLRSVWNVALHLARYARYNFTHDRSKLKVLRRRNAAAWLTKVLIAATHSFPLLSFCVSVFVWFHRYGHSDSRQFYLEAVSMVFLFGWMVNFVLFSRITQHLYVFSIVLNEIIIQDILLSFILVFVFTVVGFAFSLHALRMRIESPADADLRPRTAVYDVFISALGVGEFFDEVRLEVNYRLGLFRIVFAFYMCFAAIILLNVLIAMMNNRYEDARKRAENVWRFEVIRTAHILEDFNILSKYFGVRKWNFLCSHFKELYVEETKPGRTFVDVRLKVESHQ